MLKIKSFPGYCRVAATVAAVTGGVIGTSTTMARAQDVAAALSDPKFCWQYEGWDSQQKQWIRSERLSSGAEMKTAGFLGSGISLQAGGKILVERATEGTRRWHRVPCPTVTGTATLPFAFNSISVGIGGTVVLPNTNVSWGGTGAGGFASNTFNNASVMPTLEINIPLFSTNFLGAPVTISVEDNFMIPTGGSNTVNLTQGGFPGTVSFQQGFINETFVVFHTRPTSAMAFRDAQSGLNDISITDIFFGAGVAVDQTKTTAIFPTAGDFFSSTNTDVMPAFEVGGTVRLPGLFGRTEPGNEPQLNLIFKDILPGTDHRFGINGPSESHYKTGNVVAFTGKLSFPLSGLPFGPPPR